MSNAIAVLETQPSTPMVQTDQTLTMSSTHPWHRKTQEPAKWYERFTIYRDLGPDRSIAEAYRRYRISTTDATELDTDCNAPSTWYDNARRWDWDNRAALFDDWANRGLDLEIRRKVRTWKAQAIDDLASCWRDLQLEWRMVEPGGMSRNQISQAMKTISRETQSMLPQTSTGIDVQIVLDKLPADLQAQLAQALKLT